MSGITTQLKIAVICGGPGTEAEVSRVSAQGVTQALQANYSNVQQVELTQDIAAQLADMQPDVVFPVLHGPPGEDGTFQGLLEIMGLRYVGSGVQASACAMDKFVAKQLFRAHGLPIADEYLVVRGDNLAQATQHILNQLGEQVVIKPDAQGSGLGVHFAETAEQIQAALMATLETNEKALVEQRILGKEITVAVLERDGAEALPVIEITTPPDSWYDYEHRYTQGLSEHIIPAKLLPEQYQKTQEIAVQAHLILGCRDLSRADFVVPETGEPIILEVNTMPGMTPTSLYPDAAKAIGLSFEALVSYWIERAYHR